MCFEFNFLIEVLINICINVIGEGRTLPQPHYGPVNSYAQAVKPPYIRLEYIDFLLVKLFVYLKILILNCHFSCQLQKLKLKCN